LQYPNNNTFSLSHNPYLSDLSNSTNYLINLTVYNSNGLSRINNTFNFTTAKTIIPSVTPSAAGAGVSLGADLDAGNQPEETVNQTVTYLEGAEKFSQTKTVIIIIVVSVVSVLLVLTEIETRKRKKYKKEDGKKRQIQEHVQRSYDAMQRK